MRVAIIGVGLIGGSFALALKKARRCREVVGVGRSRKNLVVARRRGIIDSISADVAQAVQGADLVLLTTPVGQFERAFRAMAPHLKPSALVTDGGSTKRDVVAAARRGLGRRIGQFVPAHPVAGAEKSGAAAASADLFKGRRVILTPLKENTPASVRRVKSLWQACGARVNAMSPAAHDKVLAAVSHLPHVLAYALVSELKGRANAAALFAHAAGGFRDFTRIASSHPEMWRDICVANRDEIVRELRRYLRRLKRVEKLVRGGRGAALERLFEQAREARDRWLKAAWR
jgi:prephenate dehydrogenase